VPREKTATIVMISRLRPVLANIVLAKKASIARRHGLKPAKMPAAKTAIVDDMVRSLRTFLEAKVEGPSMMAEGSSLAEAIDKTKSNAVVNKIEMVQYLTACIALLDWMAR